MSATSIAYERMRQLVHRMSQRRRNQAHLRLDRRVPRDRAGQWVGVETLEPRLLLSGDVSTLWGVDEDDGQLFSIDDYTQIASGATAAGLTDFGELKYDRTGSGDIVDFGDQTQIESFTLDVDGTAFMAINSSLDLRGGQSDLDGPVLVSFNVNNASTTADNVVTVLGSIDVSGNVNGLSIHPTTGDLYGVESRSGSDRLVIISKTDPSDVTIVGTMSGSNESVESGEDIEFDEFANLYVTDNSDDELYEVNPATGAITDEVDTDQQGGLGVDSLKTEALGWDPVSNRVIASDDNANLFYHQTLQDRNNVAFGSLGGLTDVEGIDFVPVEASTLSISDDPVIKFEGDSGTTVFTFALSLSDPIGSDVVVQVDAVNGSATAADSDFQPLSQAVTFTAGGSLTQDVDVLVNGDTKVEPDESFTVDINLVKGNNIVLGNTTATGTILNDDGVTADIRQLGGTGATLPEGNSGTTGFSFEVVLSNPISSDVVLQVDTVEGSATEADNDFQPLSRTITFTPGGSLMQSFDVLVNGDTKVEPDENFTVELGITSGDDVSLGNDSATASPWTSDNSAATAPRCPRGTSAPPGSHSRSCSPTPSAQTSSFRSTPSTEAVPRPTTTTSP